MILVCITVIFLLFSCDGALNDGNYLLDLDLKPPVIQNVIINNSNSISIEFDEPVSFNSTDYISIPPLPLKSFVANEKLLTLNFDENQQVGEMYKCRTDVSDDNGNTLSFIIRYYGWNPDIPTLVINEFNPEGSGNNPDTIELYCRDDGNTAGIALFLGTANDYSESFVLPSLDVLEGDYIIIHMRPEGLIGEITETTDKAVSTGKLASDSAWDLWVDGDKAVSGKNGIISLYTNPFGNIIDAVPYSNRITADSEDYHGWTSATIGMIEELSFLDEWENTEGFIRPENAVNSEGTTGTRSICRNSLSEDNNNRDDWHIVPTGEKSFGQINSDNIYIP